MVRFANNMSQGTDTTVEAVSMATPTVSRDPGPCSLPAGIPSLTIDSSEQDMGARKSPSNQELPQRKLQPCELPGTICHNYWTHLEKSEG